MSSVVPMRSKYGVIEQMVKHFEGRAAARGRHLGLARASANKPEFVVLVESPVSEARTCDRFEAIDAVLHRHEAVGA